MNLFENKTHDAKKEQENFINEFQNKVKDKVLKFELAELRANQNIYKELGIQSYRPSQWGLIVFCQNRTFFYIAPHDTYMSYFTEGAGRTEEKVLSFAEFNSLQFSLPQKSFFSFLFPELKRTIFASYKNASGTQREFILVLNKNAQETFAELKKLTK